MPSTIDLTTGTAGGRVLDVNPNAKIVRKRVDFRTDGMGNGDTGQIIPVKAGTFVRAVGVHVLQLEGGTLTVDIGDGADPDGYFDGINLNSATFIPRDYVLAEATPNTVVGYHGGKFYTADDTIDILANNAPDTAVIDVYFEMTECNVGPALR